MRLTNKVALVTGAASGFGKAIAETYAREGAKVAVVDINERAGRHAEKAIGPAAIALRCDVARKADVDAAAAATLKAFGTIDILVNNAGTTHRNRPMLEVDEAEFDRVFAVNVKSIYLFAQAAIPVFRRQQRGVIVNIGSTAGIRPRPGQRDQGRGEPAVEIDGGRACARQDPRVCARAGRGRHGAPADVPRQRRSRRAREVRRLGAARPALAAAGRRQCGAVPGFRGG